MNFGGHDLVAQWNRCIQLTQNEPWLWLFSDDDIMGPRCVEYFFNTIAIDNGDILAGSLPYKQVKIAKKWIEENKDMLNTTWKNIKIECEMPYTGTTLSLVSSNMGV